MRVLFVTTRPAWPPYPGYQQRTGMLLEALAARHDVDAMFVLPSDSTNKSPVPPHVRPGETVIVPVPRHRTMPALVRWTRSPWPWPLMKVAWSAARPEVAARIDTGSYDVVWATDISAWPAIPHLPNVAVVLDFDDLEDHKLAHRRAARRRYGALNRRDPVFAAIETVDLRRFRRLHTEVLEHADVVTVCSEIDATRLDRDNVAVVPNGYRPPERREAGEHTGPPTLLYLGDMTYQPNVEGAHLLVNRVLPLVRAELPEVIVRVVGRYGSAVAGLAGRPGVQLIGPVPDVGPELGGADATVVPLLSGGGTRIKILEAFAYGVPVVSTTVGAEGLSVSHGEHLLVADTPEQLAAACIQVLTDPVRARELATHAHRRFIDHYTPEAIGAAVQSAIEMALNRSAT